MGIIRMFVIGWILLLVTVNCFGQCSSQFTNEYGKVNGYLRNPYYLDRTYVSCLSPMKIDSINCHSNFKYYLKYELSRYFDTDNPVWRKYHYRFPNYNDSGIYRLSVIIADSCICPFVTQIHGGYAGFLAKEFSLFTNLEILDLYYHQVEGRYELIDFVMDSSYVNLKKIKYININSPIIFFPLNRWHNDTPMTIAISQFMFTPIQIMNIDKIKNVKIQYKHPSAGCYLFLRNSDSNFLGSRGFMNLRGIKNAKLRRKFSQIPDSGYSELILRYRNGKKAIVGHFNNGNFDGEWYFYNYKGKITEYQKYNNGLPVGTWKTFGKHKQISRSLKIVDYHKRIFTYTTYGDYTRIIHYYDKMRVWEKY